MVRIIQKIDTTSVPRIFADRYRTADGPSLKVALFLLFNGDSEISSIAAQLNMSEDVVKRCVGFWESVGLLADSSSVAFSPEKKEVKKKKPVISHTEMAQAVLADSSIATLLQESQVLLGRELSMSESQLFVEMYQETALPVPVLLMIESYWTASSDTKKIPTRTLATAREWTELGIDTIAAAECRLELMAARDERYARVCRLLGTEASDLKKSERKRIDEWFESFGYDEAFVDEVRMRKPDAGIPYIHSVLKDWHKKGYSTISETRLTPANIQPAAGASPEIDPFILQALSGDNED